MKSNLSHIPIQPLTQVRYAAFKPKIMSKKVVDTRSSSNNKTYKKKGEVAKKKRKSRTTYTQYDMRDAVQFSLCDAMRCVSSRIP